ncbi:MAG: hypothetical protein HY063_07715 [Bacteroidetes bacterium]|nr:hypothetical protein [Bacteroidota bacterium]
MKNFFTSLYLLIACAIIFSSCNHETYFSMTKRHYRSGYYVEYGNGHATAKTNTAAEKTFSSELVKQEKISAALKNTEAPLLLDNPVANEKIKNAKKEYKPVKAVKTNSSPDNFSSQIKINSIPKVFSPAKKEIKKIISSHHNNEHSLLWWLIVILLIIVILDFLTGTWLGNLVWLLIVILLIILLLKLLGLA